MILRYGEITDTPTELVPTFSNFIFQIFNLYFIAGIFTYYFYTHGPKLNKFVGYILLIPFVFVVLCWNLNRFAPPILMYHHQHIFAVACGLAILGAIYSLNDLKSSVARFFEHIGDYSYALYLVHVPVLLVLYTVYFRTFGSLNSGIGFVGLALCVVTGWWVGKLDIKLHRWTKRLLK